jgi:hypothetical protein
MQIGQCAYPCKGNHTQVINIILHCCAQIDSDEKRLGGLTPPEKGKGGET